ncbi:MAG: rhombosortase [Pirellulales bacterium]
MPILTILCAAIAVAASTVPQWSGWFTYDRGAILAGETWRFLTGHVTHWNVDHLVWDVAIFGILGAMVERHDRPTLLGLILLSAAAISAATWLFHPQVEQYRGLSGLDSALFGFAVPMVFVAARSRRESGVMLFVAALAAGFVAKVGWEFATGKTLFVDSSAAGFVPLPLVHAVGALVGFALWASRRTRGSIPLSIDDGELFHDR